MQKRLVNIILVSSLIFAGCQSNNSKTEAVNGNEVETTTVQPVAPQQDTTVIAEPVAQNREEAATVELCDCMNSNLAGVSPQVREIIIAAGKSDDPMQVLTAELRKAAGDENLQRFIWELEQFERDGQLQKCGEDVKRKYKLDEGNKEQQQRFLQAAAENKNCELVYALMKIGILQEQAAASQRRP